MLTPLAGIDASLETAQRCAGSRARESRRGTMRLTLYSEAGTVASVELAPTRVVALAGRLIDAALPRLS
jgi:hypothetical protein